MYEIEIAYLVASSCGRFKDVSERRYGTTQLLTWAVDDQNQYVYFHVLYFKYQYFADPIDLQVSREDGACLNAKADGLSPLRSDIRSM